MLKTVVYQEGTLDWGDKKRERERDLTPNRNGGT